MHRQAVNFYRCPYARDTLALNAETEVGNEVQTGVLVSASGRRFPIVNGAPILMDVDQESFNEAEKKGSSRFANLPLEVRNGIWAASFPLLFLSREEADPARF